MLDDVAQVRAAEEAIMSSCDGGTAPKPITSPCHVNQGTEVNYKQDGQADYQEYMKNLSIVHRGAIL